MRWHGWIALAVLVACAAAQQQPNALIDRALDLARQRKYPEAEAAIRQVQPPPEPAARIRYYRLLASIYSGLGKSQPAAHAMEDALRIAPQDGSLQLATAVAEAAAGDWKRCLDHAGPAFAKRNDATSGLLLLRAQLATHADPSATIRSLRGLELAADQAVAFHMQVAGALAASGLHQEAALEFAHVAELDGSRPDTLYNLALEQYRSREWDKALATIEKLRATSNSAEAEDLAGDIQEARGDPMAAAHAYQQAIALAPREEKYRISLGLELLRHQSLEPAAAVFRQAAELFPSSAKIQLALGMTCFLMDRDEESGRALLKAMVLDPESIEPVRLLGRMQTEKTDGPAQAVIDAVCRRAETNPNEPAAVTWCGALLYSQAYAAGDASKAAGIVNRLHTAAALSPSDPAAACFLGQALAWTEDWKAARPALERCVQLDPASAEGHYRLGRVYQTLGLTDAARDQMKLHAELLKKHQAEVEQARASTKQFVYQLLEQKR